MIQGVIVVRGGAVEEVFMQDDRDSVCIIDMDFAGEYCPICGEPLKFGVCASCSLNWNDADTAEIANQILMESADEQFVEEAQ